MTKDALDDYPSKQEILKTIFDAVYSQYPKKEWQELTDDDVQAMWKFYEGKYYDFYTAIEQALRSKNYG